MTSPNLRTATATELSWLVDANGNPIGLRSAEGKEWDFDASGSAAGPVQSNETIPICIYGDSRASCGFNGTTNAFDLRVWTKAAPTGAVSGGNYQLRGAAVQNFYPPARIVADGSVSGETLAQMVTRETAGASATRKNLDDMWSTGGRVLIFRAGINTITSAVVAGYVQATTDAIIAAREDLIQRAVAKGFIVIDEGESGYDYVGDAGLFPQTRIDAIRQTCMAVNAAARTFAASSGGTVHYLDVFALVSDSTGQWLEGMCEDVANPGQRVHPSPRAAVLYGQAEADLLRSIFGAPVPGYVRYTQGLAESGNLIPNADLSASSGGLGTGWTVTGSGAGPVRTTNIITRDGKRWQTVLCTFTGSNAGNYGAIIAPLPINFGGTIPVVAGQVYGFEADFFLDDGNGGAPPGPSNMTVPLGRIRIYGAAGNLYYDGMVIANDKPMPDRAIAGKIVWAPTTMAESSAAITVTTAWTFAYGNVAGSTFRIGVSSPRMVRIS